VSSTSPGSVVPFSGADIFPVASPLDEFGDVFSLGAARREESFVVPPRDSLLRPFRRRRHEWTNERVEPVRYYKPITGNSYRGGGAAGNSRRKSPNTNDTKNTTTAVNRDAVVEKTSALGQWAGKRRTARYRDPVGSARTKNAADSITTGRCVPGTGRTRTKQQLDDICACFALAVYSRPTNRSPLVDYKIITGSFGENKSVCFRYNVVFRIPRIYTYSTDTV